MPFASRTAAKDAIFGVLSEVLEALAFEGVIDPEAGDKGVAWDGKAAERAKSGKKPWLFIQLSHGGGNVANLNGQPGSGRRRYNRTGLLTIQIFEPSGEGREVGDAIADRLEAVLEGRIDPESVTFRQVFSAEAGTEGIWDITNTTAVVEYSLFR